MTATALPSAYVGVARTAPPKSSQVCELSVSFMDDALLVSAHSSTAAIPRR